LSLVWYTESPGREVVTYQEGAAIGAALLNAIMAIELVLALVVVPAATAGSICLERSRGNLALMMATGLSDAEIVLGKLAAHVVIILGIVACSLPVLAIATGLGGIDPLDTVSGSLVIVGVAVLGAAVALTFSVWASQPHEALMATYATWAIWLLAVLAWHMM